MARALSARTIVIAAVCASATLLFGIWTSLSYGSSASASATTTKTFNASPGEQIFTVPDGVTSLNVTAIGGKGASGFGGGAAVGGFGAVANGTLAVTPGQILFVEVGGNGNGRSGGVNGGGNGGDDTADPGATAGNDGGGGGGGTDIRTISKSGAGNTLNSRLIIAGGGGGGGGDILFGGTQGGIGGPAGKPGFNGDGTPGTNGGGAAGGAAGAQATPNGPGTTFATGSLGQGGNGGASANDVTGGGGGGGGGGKFGGGGAGNGSGGNSSGGGAGGGSTTFAPTVTKTSFKTDTTGVPLVRITFSTGGGGGGGDNGLKFGKPIRNKKKGTALLPVTVPGSGTLSVGGAGVVHKRLGTARLARLLAKDAPQAGTYKLKIKAKGNKKVKLLDTGKVKVKPVITFTPSSGDSVSASDKFKLKKN